MSDAVKQVAKRGMLVLRLPAQLWHVTGAVELQMPADGMTLEDVANMVAQWKEDVLDVLAEEYADEIGEATKSRPISGNGHRNGGGRAAVANTLR